MTGGAGRASDVYGARRVPVSSEVMLTLGRQGTSTRLDTRGPVGGLAPDLDFDGCGDGAVYHI